MDSARELWTVLYRLADRVLNSLSVFSLKVIDTLTTEVILDYSLIEVMFGVGVGVFITTTIAKWLNPLE